MSDAPKVQKAKYPGQWLNLVGDELGQHVRTVPPKLLAAGDIVVSSDQDDVRDAEYIVRQPRNRYIITRISVVNDGDIPVSLYLEPHDITDGEGRNIGFNPAIVIKPGETFSADVLAQALVLRTWQDGGAAIRYAVFGYDTDLSKLQRRLYEYD